MRILAPRQPVLALGRDAGAVVYHERDGHYELELREQSFDDRRCVIELTGHELDVLIKHLRVMLATRPYAKAPQLRLTDGGQQWLKVAYTNRGEPFREYVAFRAGNREEHSSPHSEVVVLVEFGEVAYGLAGAKLSKEAQ